MEGRLYGLSINGDFVNCELSCDLTVTRDMVNKSGSYGGASRQYRYGYYNWSITLEAKSIISTLSGSFNNILSAQLAGQELDVYIMARVSNIQEVSIGGKVLIPNFNLTFPNTGSSRYSVTFQGNGDLNVDIEEFWNIVNSMPYNANKDIILDTNTWL